MRRAAMAPASSLSSAATSVQVALRIRPPTTQDSTSIPARFQRSVIQAASPNSVSIESPSSALAGAGAPSALASVPSTPKKQFFTFDQVHPPPTTQYELFDSTARPLISRFVEGFNCTILAYGQTSSGKTFTMTGVDLDADPSDPNNGMGIIPRAVSTIFSRAKQLKEGRGGSWNYNLKGSFIEIYNEDLIDLLSLDDATGMKREVQIREDKEGHIIWGGLREVNVKHAGEVMSLLKKGSSIRRTNETDMNAQSSRSHAIFSLTLTQKKFTGSGQPPRSSSPLPPTGRSPSRLARPGSVYAGGASGNRVSSPTFGRPSTPSFAIAMGRGGGGLRPSSALGHLGDRPNNTSDEERGEWVTIVSKFHFVDLAGSERLKRTAAAGERIKEGISINSGLLALGNVISALGDPSRAKSHTASHVPYRDSKLTRLLQDSLGGNAHTLMIACVSPAEWNAGETINTLKYANRARNIKNRAVVNEKEDGWDDIEWLQGTVSRLRKELKTIREGGLIPMGREPEVLEGAGKKVLAQMTILQNSYEDLRGKFVERTEELTRLRRELGERHRSSTSGAVAGTGKYEEIVGPVIEEYEKTIGAMEAELNLNRAALRHTNEMVEEKEEELIVITERHSATELYVEELRSRLAKLSERESSTEAYIHDLEERLKAYDETSISSSESMTDLKREVTRFKDSEALSSKYIADLEGRLSRSDDSILVLQQNVEDLEKECEHRHNEIETLQTRLDAFRQDGENWRSDLEARELKVKQLEEKMLEWEQKKKDAAESRLRLGDVVEEVVSARRSLEVDLANAPSLTNASEYPETPPNLTSSLSLPLEDNAKEMTSAETAQLLALQQTHTATLADLSSVTTKYRDALREISDLAAQIQEAKLSNPSIAESSSDSLDTDKLQDIPALRKRITSTRMRENVDVQMSPSSRRLFFRQAPSAESLHARSLSFSQSLSQELSSAHSRKTSSSSHGTGSSSYSSPSSHSPSFPPAQLTLHNVGLRSNTSKSMPSLNLSPTRERSIPSLEQEIMRLQEVLKDREREISLLEESLKESQQDKPPSSAGSDSNRDDVCEVDEEPLMPDAMLSPKTLNQFDHIRKTMEGTNGHAVYSENPEDESLERLNELMLSMAQKESHHREVVEDLNTQLLQARRQLDELTALSRDQTLNMSMEIEALQKNHNEDLVLLEDARKHEAELVASLEAIKIAHKAEIDQLRVEHEEAIKAKTQDLSDLLSSIERDHETSTSRLRTDLEAATTSLEMAQKDHETAFGKLKIEHEKILESKVQEAKAVLATTVAEHEKALTKIHAEHAVVLRRKEEDASAVLQTTEEEYYNALTKLRGDHAEAIKTVATETNATIERLRQEHAGEMRMIEIAKEGSLSESESARNLALKSLQDEHGAAIARKEASFAEEIESLSAGYTRTFQAKDDDHTLQMDRLRLEHETAISRLKSDWREEAERLAAALSTEKDDNAATIQKTLQKHEAAIRDVREQQALVIQEFERGHEDDLASLKRQHQAEIQNVTSQKEQDQAVMLEAHTGEVQQLKLRREQDVSELESRIADAEKQYRNDIQEAQSRNDRILLEEKDRLDKIVADLEMKQSEERERGRTDRELLAKEIKNFEIAAEKATLLREQAQKAHENELQEKFKDISSLADQLAVTGTERDGLEAEVSKLRAELDDTRKEQSKLIQEASKRESLVIELESYRTNVADLQENLQKVKDEKETLLTERNKSDALLRELQAQLARSISPPGVRSPDRSFGFQRNSNLPHIKVPPPTPPPSVPPPPAPRSSTVHLVNGESQLLSASSQNFPFASPKESQPDTPISSAGHSTSGPSSTDSKFTVKLEQQNIQLEEQEAMIKTLNKQLTHCESDLQTHMDLVSTLETSLGDCEKNLRKARMQATELARERDALNVKVEGLSNDLADAKREVMTVRRSVVEEKQSLEQRLDEERKAKERARQQLDSRMEELQRRKSKFACL